MLTDDARIDFPDTSHAYDMEFERRLGIRAAIREIDATIAALGLSNTEEAK